MIMMNFKLPVNNLPAVLKLARPRARGSAFEVGEQLELASASISELEVRKQLGVQDDDAVVSANSFYRADNCPSVPNADQVWPAVSSLTVPSPSLLVALQVAVVPLAPCPA